MDDLQARFEHIRRDLKAGSNPDIVKKYSRYFREGYDAYGLDLKSFERLCKDWIREWKKDLGFEDFLLLGEKLMATGKYEEASCAIVFAEAFQSAFTPAHLEIFGNWLEHYVRNWAHTDIMCGRLIPVFLHKKIVEPAYFIRWIPSPSKWKRRAIPVSFLSILGQHTSYRDLFSIIDPLMMDKEDMVQKGLGWFLREAWKKEPDRTEEFLMVWKDSCPRLIIHYATERMEKDYRLKFRKEKKTIKTKTYEIQDIRKDRI